MENFLKQARKALHSYTHSGALQLGRHLDGDEIKPHYSEGEIYEVINVTSSAAFMVTSLLTKHFGLDEEWQAAARVFAEWGRHSEPSGPAALG
jgi:hypothetical protein